jgi:hypothetical protein
MAEAGIVRPVETAGVASVPVPLIVAGWATAELPVVTVG